MTHVEERLLAVRCECLVEEAPELGILVVQKSDCRKCRVVRRPRSEGAAVVDGFAYLAIPVSECGCGLWFEALGREQEHTVGTQHIATRHIRVGVNKAGTR